VNKCLESAHAKIIRALKLRECLEKGLTEYRNRKPYRIISNPNGESELEITEQPPLEISIIAGEVIYQLRSALDHIFFALIRRGYPGGNVPSEIRDISKFPLCSKPPGDPLKKPPIPRTSFGKAIPTCIPDEAFTIIEILQPYNRKHHGHDLLNMLRVFSNIDKHRQLNTTVTRIDRKHTITAENLTSSVTFPALESGAKLYEPIHFINMDEFDKNAIEVEEKYIVIVAFDEPGFGPPETTRIEEVMYNLPSYVSLISTFFNRFFAAPAGIAATLAADGTAKCSYGYEANYGKHSFTSPKAEKY
jgi:hypothetical protein